MVEISVVPPPTNASGSNPFRSVKRQCSSVVSGIGKLR